MARQLFGLFCDAMVFTGRGGKFPRSAIHVLHHASSHGLHGSVMSGKGHACAVADEPRMLLGRG